MSVWYSVTKGALEKGICVCRGESLRHIDRWQGTNRSIRYAKILAETFEYDAHQLDWYGSLLRFLKHMYGELNDENKYKIFTRSQWC